MKRLAGSLNKLGPLLGSLALLAAELRQRMAHPGQPRPEQHLAVLIHDEPTSATKYTYRVDNPATVSGYCSSVPRTLTTTLQSLVAVTLVTYTDTGDWQG